MVDVAAAVTREFSHSVGQWKTGRMKNFSFRSDLDVQQILSLVNAAGKATRKVLRSCCGTFQNWKNE